MGRRGGGRSSRVMVLCADGISDAADATNGISDDVNDVAF